MATYRLENSYDTVQVLSPTLAVEAIYCTIQTSPSGSIVQRAVPKTEFASDQGEGILSSLATAVEDMIAGGLASSASGTQGVDSSGLIFDAVTFTVQYTPPTLIAGTLTTTVDVPVDVLTADTSFGSFLTGGSAQERVKAAYDSLVKLAGG
jgi:hypothetical protein